MNWVLLIGAAWLAVAVFVGVLIGRGIRLADRKQVEAFAAEVPAARDHEHRPPAGIDGGDGPARALDDGRVGIGVPVVLDDRRQPDPTRDELVEVITARIPA